MEPIDIPRPFEVIKYTTSIDEKLCFIVDDSVCSDIADLELPDTFCCVPLGVLDFVLKLDVLVDEIVLFIYRLQVFEDLW